MPPKTNTNASLNQKSEPLPHLTPLTFTGYATTLVRFGVHPGNDEDIRWEEKLTNVTIRGGSGEITLLTPPNNQYLSMDTLITHIASGMYICADGSSPNLRIRFWRMSAKKPVIVSCAEPEQKGSLPMKPPKANESESLSISEITRILMAFAQKVDQDFNLMSVCDVDPQKYVQDYIRKEIKGEKKFNVDASAKEFADFLDEEAEPAVKLAEEKLKEEVKEHPLPKVTPGEYKLWFQSSSVKVPEIRDTLKQRNIPGITSKSTKKQMDEIVSKLVTLSTEPPTNTNTEPKKRGRPPKNTETPQATSTELPKKRGRPKQTVRKTTTKRDWHNRPQTF